MDFENSICFKKTSFPQLSLLHKNIFRRPMLQPIHFKFCNIDYNNLEVISFPYSVSKHLGFLENYDEFKGQFELGKENFHGNTLENVFLVWSDQYQQLLLLKI